MLNDAHYTNHPFLCQYLYDFLPEGVLHMTHSYTLTVRSYECDMHRHVNNAVYLNYLEAARMGFLNDVNFGYEAFLDAGYALFIANINIAYKAPAFLNDMLTVETTPIKRKRLSGIFLQEIKRQEALLARAEVTWACVNRSGKPVPLPEEFSGPWLNPEPVTVA
jgi:acyl-CoA thioester hydrolase